jgi:hypothetical protein
MLPVELTVPPVFKLPPVMLPLTLAELPVITPPTTLAAVTVPVTLTVVPLNVVAYTLLKYFVELPRLAVVLANGNMVLVERWKRKNSLLDKKPKPNTISLVVPTLPVDTTKFPPDPALP